GGHPAAPTASVCGSSLRAPAALARPAPARLNVAMAQAPVTIRPARAADMAAIGEIVAGSWWRTFSGLLPQDVLVSITPEAQKSRHERGFAREDLHYRVACGNGEVVGFASWGPARDPGFAVFCELYALYLRPGWERQGI